MDFVDALQKLGFSFWQIIVIGVIIMFRSEFRKLIQRIASLKVGNNEIILTAEQNDTISELKSIQGEIEKHSPSDKVTIELIEQKIQNRLLVALSNLKSGTSFLWPALLDAEEGMTISVDIRSSTLNKIEKDLRTLMQANLLYYKLNTPQEIGVYEGVHESVYKVSVQITSPKLVELIKLVRSEY